MKLARFVLKIVGFSLAAAALACCMVAYWDKLTALCAKMSVKAGNVCATPSEYDDYADWEG